MSDAITNAFEDNPPLVGYLITVSAILRYEGHEAWAENISKAASKINKMQKEIESLRRQLEPFTTFASAESVTHLRAKNEKLRAALKPFADAAEHIGAGWGDDDSVGVGHAVGDLRAAAAALKETEK